MVLFWRINNKQIPCCGKININLTSEVGFFLILMCFKERKNMKKTIKLKKNYEFNNTFKRGKYFSGNLIECFYTKNNKNINYLGIAISSKLCNAVKRNKVKRLIRESYRNLENVINTGNTFVFLLKKKTQVEGCNYNNVLKDMRDIFEKIGIIYEKSNN